MSNIRRQTSDLVLRQGNQLRHATGWRIFIKLSVICEIITAAGLFLNGGNSSLLLKTTCRRKRVRSMPGYAKDWEKYWKARRNFCWQPTFMKPAPLLPAGSGMRDSLQNAVARRRPSLFVKRCRTHPENSEEAYVANQLMAKLTANARTTAATDLLGKAETITIARADAPVEILVLNYYRNLGWNGVHSENWLWNAVFGLLCWDIIYDPGYGSFSHSLQIAPGDIHHMEFYTRRTDAFESRFLLLANKQRCSEHLLQTWNDKKNINNPFVAWGDDVLAWVETLLQHIPSHCLAAVLRHVAQNVKCHRVGFPDLFICRDGNYEFIEVKSPNDKLSGRQYNWITFLQAHHIQVKVLKIRYEKTVLDYAECE